MKQEVDVIQEVVEINEMLWLLTHFRGNPGMKN